MSLKPKVARDFLYPVKSHRRDMGSSVVTYDNCDPSYRELSLAINHQGHQVRFNFHFDGFTQGEKKRAILEARHALGSLITAIERVEWSIPDAGS